MTQTSRLLFKLLHEYIQFQSPPIIAGTFPDSLKMLERFLKKFSSILLGPYILKRAISVPEMEIRSPRMFSSRSRASFRTEKFMDFL